jgi:hypothetical protein
MQGIPIYVIGTPSFPYIRFNLPNGEQFEIIALNFGEADPLDGFVSIYCLFVFLLIILFYFILRKSWCE